MPRVPRHIALVAALLLATAALAASQAPEAIPPGPALPGESSLPGEFGPSVRPVEHARWEYKVLPRTDVVRRSPKHRGEFIKPEDVLGDLNAGLAALGNEGWELVALEPYHKEGYVSWPTLYIFRRPR